MYKLIIQLFKNGNSISVFFTLAPLVKYPLNEGINTVGNDQSYDICISNKNIVSNHCQLIVNSDEVELEILDGPVYILNGDGDWDLYPKNTTLTLNIHDQEPNVRLGNQVLVKLMFDNTSKKRSLKSLEQQVKSKAEKENEDIKIQNQDQLEIKFVESQIIPNPLFDIFQENNENKKQLDNIEDSHQTPQFVNNKDMIVQNNSVDGNSSNLEMQQSNAISEENNKSKQEVKVQIESIRQNSRIIEEKQRQKKQKEKDDYENKNENQHVKENNDYEEKQQNDEQQNNEQLDNEKKYQEGVQKSKTGQLTIIPEVIEEKKQKSSSKQTKKKQKQLLNTKVKSKIKETQKRQKPYTEAKPNQKTMDSFLKVNSPNPKSKKKQIKSLQKDIQQVSNRKQSLREKFNVIFSAFSPTNSEIQFLTNQKGINISADPYTFNILIMESPIHIRTYKLLLALSRNIPIISRQWITESLEKFELLEMKDYPAKFSEQFCQDYCFNYKNCIQRYKKCQEDKKLPFEDIKFTIPLIIRYHITDEELELLILELGGNIVNDGGIVFAPKNQGQLSKEYKKSVPIENLFQSVMQYKNCL